MALGTESGTALRFGAGPRDVQGLARPPGPAAGDRKRMAPAPD